MTTTKLEPTPMEELPSPKRKGQFWGCLLGIGTIVVIVFLILWKLGFVTIGAVKITSVYLSSGLNDQGTPIPLGNAIPPDQSRIICMITISAPKPIMVWVKWFYEDQLLAEQNMRVDQRQGFFIATKEGEKFKEGNYRVDVYLAPDGNALRTLTFTVQEPAPNR